MVYDALLSKLKLLSTLIGRSRAVSQYKARSIQFIIRLTHDKTPNTVAQIQTDPNVHLTTLAVIYL
jgi:hypothetical protein